MNHKALAKAALTVFAGLVLAGCATRQTSIEGGARGEQWTTNRGCLLVADGSIHYDAIRSGSPGELYVEGKVVSNRARVDRFQASGNVIAGRIVIGGTVPRVSNEPTVQNAYDNAIKVLYKVTDSSPPIVAGRTEIYATYLKDSDVCTTARSDLDAAMRNAMADPKRAESWPVDGAIYSVRIDAAMQKLVSTHAVQVEMALNVIAAVPGKSDGDWPLVQDGSPGWMDLATGSFYSNQTTRPSSRPFVSGSRLANGMFVPSSRAVIY
jgi:hypothetical protein